MKIKILYINIASKIGGSEVSLLNLIKNLDKDKYEPYLFCSDEGMLTEEARKYGATILLGEFPENFRRDLKFMPILYKMYKLFSKYKFDLIHANSYLAGFSVALVAKLLRIPLITHVRDIIPDTLFQMKVESRLLNLTDKFICISNSVRERLIINGYKDNKISTIANGVDLNLFNSNIETAELKQNYKALKFGIVGQIIDWKGHEDLLEAIAIIKNKGLQSDFYFIGSPMFNDPTYLDFLKEKASSLSINNFVHFIPFQKDIAPWMNALDVVICPSWIEPFGRVVIEGMALKKLVIATNKGGPSEIIQDGKSGILVNPKDPINLANAIIKCIENPNLLNDFGTNAFDRVESLYTIDKHVKHIQEIYGSCIKKRR